MSYTLSFVKMHGAGNDFIMIDGRTLPALNLSCAQIAALCHRQLGVGADGLIVIRHDPEVDFCMVYYNANGSEAEMCGNGARCAVAFAQRFGMVGDHCRFQTSAGVLIGRLVDREVSVSLPPWRDWRPDLKLEGSPHASHLHSRKSLRARPRRPGVGGPGDRRGGRERRPRLPRRRE